MPEPFDRDATKEALPVVAQALMNGGVQGCDEFSAGAAVLDAARWAFRSGGSIGRVGGRGTVMGEHAGFVVCGECEGGGCYHCKSAASKHDHSKYPCPTCRGSGLVATDELREKATDTLLHVLYLGADRSQLGSTQVRMHERAADAVLRLVAETIGGKK